MNETPWWVAILLGAVFLALAGGLAYMARLVEPWARRLLRGRAAMWALLGVGVVAYRWRPGLGGAFLVLAVLVRLAVALRPTSPWRRPRTPPTPG